jgi:hypothetical protein
MFVIEIFRCTCGAGGFEMVLLSNETDFMVLMPFICLLLDAFDKTEDVEETMAAPFGVTEIAETEETLAMLVASLFIVADFFKLVGIGGFPFVISVFFGASWTKRSVRETSSSVGARSMSLSVLDTSL